MMFEHFTHDTRHIVSFAMEEAADLGHTHLGNDHLILGMLCNARSPIHDRLVATGFTLADAREVVRSSHADDTDDVADSEDAQVAEDRDALRSVGIDLDTVTEAIKNAFGTDITDGWSKRGPERRGRGGPSGDHPHGRGHRGDRRDGPGASGEGPWEQGRGRRGPRGRGGPHRRPRFSPDAKAAVATAVATARANGSERITAEDFLLGILNTDDARSRALIASVTTPEALRDTLAARQP